MRHRLISILLPSALFAAALAQNAAKPRELKFRVQQLCRDNNEGLAVGDINKDGKLDVMAGEFWYAAPDFAPRPVRKLIAFGKDYLQNCSDHLCDLNGDGWLDLISNGFTQSDLAWFENPGPKLDTATEWTRHPLHETGTTTNEASFLHDLDSDGVPEFLINRWTDDSPMWGWRFRKNSDGQPGLEKFIIAEKGNGHGMGFGDINGDGLEDIVFKRGWYQRPKEGPFAGPWKYHDDFELPEASCPILVTDLNGDGRMDMIWGDGHNYGLYWEQQLEHQPDGTTTWRHHSIDKSFSQAHALAWEDIDNDGQPELITGKRYYAHSGSDPGANDPVVIYYYDWDRATLKFSRRTISNGPTGQAPGIGLQIRVADLDGNGWKDIVVPGKSGTHIVWNQGWSS